jgi:hypothetical protein
MLAAATWRTLAVSNLGGLCRIGDRQSPIGPSAALTQRGLAGTARTGRGKRQTDVSGRERGRSTADTVWTGTGVHCRTANRGSARLVGARTPAENLAS